MPRALAKKCGKLISIKLVLRNIYAKAMKVNWHGDLEEF